jgi:hypothetical protein
VLNRSSLNAGQGDGLGIGVTCVFSFENTGSSISGKRTAGAGMRLMSLSSATEGDGKIDPMIPIPHGTPNRRLAVGQQEHDRTEKR